MKLPLPVVEAGWLPSGLPWDLFFLTCWSLFSKTRVDPCIECTRRKLATGKVAAASVDPKRPFVSMWNRVARSLFSSLAPSCPVTSCLLFSCPLLFRHSLSCLVPPCPVTSCLLFSCPLFSRHLLSSLLLSPLVPSHLALSPLVLPPLVFSSCIACRRMGFVRSR